MEIISMVVWDHYDNVEVTSEWEQYESGTRTYITNPTWFVESAAGERIERETRGSAVALATLFERMGQIEMVEDRDDVVPTRIAIEGMPAIVTYLRGVHQMSKGEISEELNVTDETVSKYITRFRPHTRS